MMNLVQFNLISTRDFNGMELSRFAGMHPRQVTPKDSKNSSTIYLVVSNSIDVRGSTIVELKEFNSMDVRGDTMVVFMGFKHFDFRSS